MADFFCFYCSKSLNCKGWGRVPSYCSSACRQASYRLRKNNYQRKRFSSRALQIEAIFQLVNVTKVAGIKSWKQEDWVEEGAFIPGQMPPIFEGAIGA
jgi:hypothetical protein